MLFDIPIGSLPSGDYYILFDYGVAIFDEYCKSLSESITHIISNSIPKDIF